MALSQDSLAAALTATLSNTEATPEGCANAMASDYYTYAAAGTFGSSAVAIPPANQSAMASTLLAAISSPVAGSAGTFAAAWAAAVALFWTGVPVTGAQSGATVGCPGAALLSGSLLPILTVTAGTAASAAGGIASALHAATMTVTAAVAPPPGTTLTIL